MGRGRHNGCMASPAIDLTTKPTLEGDLVLLRPLDGHDVDAMAAILGDPQVRILTGSVTSTAEAREPFVADEEFRNWYASRPDQDDRRALAIVERATGALAGEVVLNEVDRDRRTANLRILIGLRWQDRGLGTEAVRLLTGYALTEIGLREVTLGVLATNPRAHRVYEKIGYRVVRTRTGAVMFDGAPVDEIVMSMSIGEG